MPDNKWLNRLNEVEQEDEQDRLRSYSLTDTPTPDQVAQDLALARKAGVPRISVEQNRDVYQRQDEWDRINKATANAPRVRKWLSADPENYAIAKDDVEALSQIERSFGQRLKEDTFLNPLMKGDMKGALVSSLTSSVQLSRNTLSYGQSTVPMWLRQAKGTLNDDRLSADKTYQDAVRVLALQASGSDAQKARREEIMNDPWVKGFMPDGRKFRALLGMNEQMPEMVTDSVMSRFTEVYGPNSDEWKAYIFAEPKQQVALLKEVIQKTDARTQADLQEFRDLGNEVKRLQPDTGDFVANNMLQGVSSAVNMLPSILATLATKRPVIGAGIMGAQVYGEDVGAGVAEDDLSIEDARSRAIQNTFFEFAFERFALKYEIGLLGDGSSFASKMARGAVAEQVQEQPTTLFQDYVDWQITHPEKTPEEFIAERPERAAQTFWATLVASGMMQGAMIAVDHAIESAYEKERRAQLSKGEIAIEDAIKAVQKSKLSGRHQAKAEEVLSDIARSNDVEKVNIDLDGVVEALNQKGVDPGTVLEALGISREQAVQDHARFGESEIEFAKLMSSPAVREHLEDIRPHLRTPGDPYTPAQKEKIRNDLPNEIKARMEAVQAAFEGTAELADREAQAAELVRERILGAGVWGENKVNDANATIAAAMNNTFADLAGMDPVDFFEAHFPRIQMSVDGMVQEQGGDMPTVTDGSEINTAERLAFFENDPELQEIARAEAERLATGNDRISPDDYLSNPGFWERIKLENLKAKSKEAGDAYQDVEEGPEKEKIGEEWDRLKAEIKAEVQRQKDVVTSAKQADTLNQGEETHRGQFAPTQNIITLFEGRNYSTLMHEMSHWFLFQMEQFAKEENAPPAIQKMWKDVNAWYDGLDRSKAFEVGSRERWVDFHETFAETFETYLETGQAPSVGLRDAFRAFKSWLATLWKTVRGRATELQRANLDPEIVAIFDRMLATEEEITAATQQTYTEAETVAKGLLDAGILPQKEYDKAIKNLDDAREAVKEEMMKRLMADVNREDEAWWKTERERVKGEKTREFDRSPIGRAWSWLGAGAWKGDVPVTESPGDVARADVEALYQRETPGTPEYERAIAKGLDMSTEARMQRAREMGYDTDTVLYHGTARGGFSEFDPYGTSAHGLFGQGVYLTDNPEVASSYTTKGKARMERRGETPREAVYPVVIKLQNPIDMEAKADVEAWRRGLDEYGYSPEEFEDAGDIDLSGDVSNEEMFRALENVIIDEQIPMYEGAERVQDILRTMGHDGVTHVGGGRVNADGVRHNVSIVFDPENIRSVNAAFDPDMADSPNLLYQTAARTTLDDVIREAEQNNAELDHEIQTVRDMLNEAAACAAGVAPAAVGEMVVGITLGGATAAAIAIPFTMNSPMMQAERERRMKEWHLQEHKRLMKEDPEYRAKHDQYRAREQERYDNALAEYRAAREFEQKLEAYADIDNMPTDNTFDMNSWTEQVSGVSAEFLDDLFGHEADGDWQAEAGTSTAKGGGQFIDSTWLRMMRQHGPELGLNPGMSRDEILALRTDRRWGTMMTAYYAMENRATLEKKMDRPVTQKDAYLAHFLGATAAAKALTMDQGANAAEAFPAAAEANQNVFYKYGNLEKPRTVAEMIERQTKGFSAEPLMVWDYPVEMNAEPNDGRVDR